MTNFKYVQRFMWLNEEMLNELNNVTHDFQLIHSVTSEEYGPHTLVRLGDAGLTEMQEYHAGYKDGIETELPW